MKNKILITVLIILVLGLGGYLVYDKVIKDDSESSTLGHKDKSTNTGSIAFDLTDAEKVIEPYVKLAWNHKIVIFDGLNQKEQRYIAFENVDSDNWKPADCKSLYDGNEEFIKEEDGRYLGEDYYYCYSDSKQVSYNIINSVYKKLYGLDKNIEKSSFTIFTSKYDYVESINGFVKLFCDGGSGSSEFSILALDNAVKNGNELTIIMAYNEIKETTGNTDYLFYVDLGNERFTWESSEVTDQEKFKNDFITKYKDKMDKYEFNFVYDTDHYYLKSVNKVLYQND